MPTAIAKLGKDSVFGEVSLYTEEPRSATVTVTSDTAHILKITRELYRGIMASNNRISHDVRLKIAIEAIRRAPILEALSNTAKDKLVNNLHPSKYIRNATITKQGGMAHAFYVITEGVCGISVRVDNTEGNGSDDVDVDGEDHSETILLRRLYPGDVFGRYYEFMIGCMSGLV